MFDRAWNLVRVCRNKSVDLTPSKYIYNWKLLPHAIFFMSTFFFFFNVGYYAYVKNYDNKIPSRKLYEEKSLRKLNVRV